MNQIRLKDELTNEELRELLARSEARNDELTTQLVEAHETIEKQKSEIIEKDTRLNQLELQMEAVGAGGVSGQRITGASPLECWYVVDNAGIATLCNGAADARDCADEYPSLYPKRAPYRVARLVSVE